MKGIPPRFIPTGEQQRYNLEPQTPQVLDLASLNIKPAGALFTCYSGNSEGKAGIGLSGDFNGYSLVLQVGESCLIQNFLSLVDLNLNCIGETGATANVTVVFLTQL